MRRSAWLAVLATLPLLAPACSSDADEKRGADRDDRLVVVATMSILGDVVENVTGDDADVEVLVPLGVDPHGFEPSPQDVRRLEEADLVVANGLGLEEPLADVLGNAERSGTAVLEVAPEVDPIPLDDGHEALDPHFWTDPVRVADAAKVIATALDELDNSVDWQARAARYADRVLDAHKEIEEILSPIPEARRKLVTNHEVFGYFAARYGFEVLGAVVPGGSTLAESSGAALSGLARLLRDEDVPAIFAETTQPTRLADALAAEVGSEVKVVALFTESLGEPGSEGETYLEMMLTDARRIADALCSPLCPAARAAA